MVADPVDAMAPPDPPADGPPDDYGFPWLDSPVQKVSVSIPGELLALTRTRVGHGELSRYITGALVRRLEQERLSELLELFRAEHGPIPEEYLAEARAAWPDAK